MAARVLLRRRVAAPFTAAALVGAALFPSVALAEAPPSQDHHYTSKKKPIYDDYEQFPRPKFNSSSSSAGSTLSGSTLVSEPASDSAKSPESPVEKLEQQDQQQQQPDEEDEGGRHHHHHHHSPSPTDRLAAQIGRARLFLHGYAAAAEDGVNAAADRAFRLERSLTETVASLAPARDSGETLMPGLVYVLVAGMAGSIAARNRGLALRAAAPLALGLGAARLLLPVTTANVADLAWRYEQRLPALAAAHARADDRVRAAWRFLVVHAAASRRYVDDRVADARDLVEGWVRKGK
ncbi:apolipo protein O-domain-containing protein [Durotheca rogersii]|uniref:apolipo protein O-domain-containing protein n=1 Tax=Durotheca rogersii TaxID=419775 RepID=UPI00221F6EE5|nr:apolipo protein O-domain-containing protein [Durotheca rogersii]KAI5861766.1 apolipo protein O-domain-containing protein [Durotheca rogersii]